MTFRTTSDFRRSLEKLPTPIKRQAAQAYRLFAQDPSHPILKFKKLPPHDDIWSVRINADYRAVGARIDDVIVCSLLDHTQTTIECCEGFESLPR